MEMKVEIVEMKCGKFTLVRIDGTLFDVKEHNVPIIRRNRRNHIGTRSKTYGTYVSDTELTKVHQAICKVGVGYVPTSPVIARETTMTIFRVRAAIDVLLRRGSIRKAKDGIITKYASLVTPKEE